MLKWVLIYRSYVLNLTWLSQINLRHCVASTKAKLLCFLLLGVGSYLLLTLIVVFFYQDNTEQMNWVDREAFNNKVIAKYKPYSGLMQTEIIQRLGSPDITEAIKTNADLYQILYYRSNRNNADGITTADECTALLLKNRQLIAIGPDAVNQFSAVKQYEDR